MKEIVSRPKIKTIWKWVERTYLPHYPMGYTVNEFIREEFRKLYKLDYAVIRNAAVFQENQAIQKQNQSFILYQGAVNEGRSFETLIPAMKWVDLPLYICGTGNFMEKAKRLVIEHGLENKVLFKGNLLPEALKALTSDAVLGLTLFDGDASNTYQSLANRFFDYMHAGIPQVCVDYPQYRAINDELPVAILISNLSSESIAAAINELIRNKDLHSLLSNNALIASKKHCWQEEEKVLLSYYKQQFP
jgi:glycosyltransferase involved in cell wall biosynthesis